MGLKSSIQYPVASNQQTSGIIGAWVAGYWVLILNGVQIDLELRNSRTHSRRS
jgi:hypothetical protein